MMADDLDKILEEDERPAGAAGGNLHTPGPLSDEPKLQLHRRNVSCTAQFAAF
jgi:hypothetical protein